TRLHDLASRLDPVTRAPAEGRAGPQGGRLHPCPAGVETVPRRHLDLALVPLEAESEQRAVRVVEHPRDHARHDRRAPLVPARDAVAHADVLNWDAGAALGGHEHVPREAALGPAVVGIHDVGLRAVGLRAFRGLLAGAGLARPLLAA